MKSKQRKKAKRNAKKDNSGFPSHSCSIESTDDLFSLLRSWVKQSQFLVRRITECRKDLSLPYDLWPSVSPHPRVSFLLCICILYIMWTCLRIPSERVQSSHLSFTNTTRPSVVFPSASQPLLFSSFFQLFFRSLSLLLVLTFVYRVFIEWMSEDEKSPSSISTQMVEGVTSRPTPLPPMHHTGDNRTSAIDAETVSKDQKEARAEEENPPSSRRFTNEMTKKSGGGVPFAPSSSSSTSSAFGFSSPSNAKVDLLADNAVHFVFAVWIRYFLLHEEYPLRPVACQLELYKEKYKSENAEIPPPALLMCRRKRALILFGIPFAGVLAQHLPPSFLLLLVGAAVTVSFLSTVRQEGKRK